MLGSPATGRLLVELMEPLRGWLVSARAPGGKVTNAFGHGKSFPFWESVTFPIDSRFFFREDFFFVIFLKDITYKYNFFV